MSNNYRDVHFQINSEVPNISSSISNEDVIEMIHNQLAQVFGLYIDRDQITIKDGE